MILKKDILESLPPVDSSFEIPSQHSKNNQVIVVLDDDPTGTQTSHGVTVITEWAAELLREAMQEDVFFILTNSRSLDAVAAYELISEISEKVQGVAKDLGQDVLFITRTDSTLRGHFMAEPDAVQKAAGWNNVLRVFVPAFLEGGRYTIENQHYVQEGEVFVHASETPFARDASFGYASSHLYEYILEKDESLYSRESIFDLSIDEIRKEEVVGLTEKILSQRDKKYLIINAADQTDLNKAAVALQEAKDKGINLIIRSAAGIVPALACIPPKPLLDGAGIRTGKEAGLIVVGSYVPKTSEQLKCLMEDNNLTGIEVEVSELISASAFAYIQQKSSELNQSLAENRDCVLYTSRRVVTGSDASTSLEIVNQVSNGLISIVNHLELQPGFIIAKGGITSSDVATKALRIKKAEVMGQLLPGVPVWKSGEDSKYPGLPYVIFPGNVGSKESLSQAYQKIAKA